MKRGPKIKEFSFDTVLGFVKSGLSIKDAVSMAGISGTATFYRSITKEQKVLLSGFKCANKHYEHPNRKIRTENVIIDSDIFD